MSRKWEFGTATIQPPVGVWQVLERLLEAPERVVESDALRALPVQDGEGTISVYEKRVGLPGQTQPVVKERYLGTKRA
jgi:hypothetical protein